MRNLRAIALLGAVGLAIGCIPSVNPFYTAEDVVFDSRLLGQWQEKGAKDTPQLWQFEKLDDKSYKLIVTEKPGKQGALKAVLFKIRREYFLDLVPIEWKFATNEADLVAASMFPGHLLAHVTRLEPELELAFFEFDWLAEYLKQNPTAIAHRKEGDNIVLTARTRALQRFVLRHLQEGKLFKKPGQLVRVNKPPAPDS